VYYLLNLPPIELNKLSDFLKGKERENLCLQNERGIRWRRGCQGEERLL
jgi:hypothetical protein